MLVEILLSIVVLLLIIAVLLLFVLILEDRRLKGFIRKYYWNWSHIFNLGRWADQFLPNLQHYRFHSFKINNKSPRNTLFSKVLHRWDPLVEVNKWYTNNGEETVGHIWLKKLYNFSNGIWINTVAILPVKNTGEVENALMKKIFLWKNSGDNQPYVRFIIP